MTRLTAALLFSLFIAPVFSAANAAEHKVSIVREDCAGLADCYTSLADWAAAYGGVPGGDLVAADKIAVARIEGAWSNPDEKPVSLYRWTTDANHYIWIYTTPEARHRGVTNTGYRLRTNSTNSPFNSSAPYLRLEGLEIHYAGAGSASPLVIRPLNNSETTDGIGEVRIAHNLIHGNGLSSNNGIQFYTFGGKSFIYNNIIYAAGFSSSGAITTDGMESYIYNNTIASTITGFGIRAGANINTAKNNIVISQAACFYSPFVDSDHNTCSNSGGTNGPHDQINIMPAFRDAAAEDFHLAANDTVARESGANLKYDLTLPFSDDVDGMARCGYWDIGADQVEDLTACSEVAQPQNLHTSNVISRILTPNPALAGSGKEYSVDLAWNAGGPNAGYHIYRNGISISDTAGLSYNDRSVVALNQYTYRVVAFDAVGNESRPSEPAVLEMPVPSDEKPPHIIVVSVRVDNAANSADISWATDEPAIAGVEYGATAAYGATADGGDTYRRYHSIKITGLADGHTYHYRASSTDREGNTAVSADYSFTVNHAYACSTFYVSAVTGNNANPGSRESPWATIQHAADTVQPGDTVIVLPGDYTRTVITNRRLYSGNSYQYLPVGVPGYPVTIKGQSAVDRSHIRLEPLFNPAGPFPQRIPGNSTLNAVTRGFSVQVSYASTVPVEYVNIENFEITNIGPDTGAAGGIRFSGQDTAPVRNIQAKGNVIHDLNPAGYGYIAIRTESNTASLLIKDNFVARSPATNIVINGENSLVEGNDVSHNVSVNTETGTYIGGDSDGIRFFGSGHIIRYNYIHDIMEQECTGHIDCFQTFTANGETVRNILVESNYCSNTGQMFMSEDSTEEEGGANNHHDITFRNNVFRGAVAAAFHISNMSDNFTFVNNVLASTGLTGMGLTSYYPTVVNNIFYMNGGGTSITSKEGLTGAVMDYNWHMPNFTFPGRYPHLERHSSFGADPQLENPETGDYRLTDHSPARGTGINWPEIEATNLVDPGPLGDFWTVMGEKAVGRPLPPGITPTPGGSSSSSSSSSSIGAYPAKRAACSADEGLLSSVAIVRGGKVYLINPADGKAAAFDVKPPGKVLLGNFDAAASGPEGFAALEVAQTTAESSALHWKIASSETVSETSFGSQKSHPLNCYIDPDLNADKAVWDKAGFSAHLSGNGTVAVTNFTGLGRIREAICADLNGDGGDELVVLHTKNPAQRQRSSGRHVFVSTFDALSGAHKQTRRVDARARRMVAADIDGDGDREICYAVSGTGARSAIVCNYGKKRFSVPEIADLAAGHYSAKRRADGFAVLGRDGRLYLIHGRSAVQLKSKQAALGARVRKNFKLALCR